MRCASFSGAWKRNASRVLLALVASLCGAPAASPATIDIPQKPFLIDEVVPIVVSGLPPASTVTIQLRGPDSESTIDYRADANGVADLTKSGDPMELFWSARKTSHREADDRWDLTAVAGGKTVATTSVIRRAVAADVKVTAVHDRGLVGELYIPPGEGKHAAVIVVTGSGGGIPPAAGQSGGLASRGYVVLALAYFNARGLPSSLSYIPLEYFATALDWLSKQPSVDPERIGILGISRGAELALLLASAMTKIHAVVAYMPSSVVISGCCSGRGEPAWTVGGKPVAYVPPRRQGDFALRQQAAIRVEQIHGGVLLLSGTEDEVWPSDRMSDEIMDRLRRNHFAYPFKHLSYEHTGHGIGRPFTSTADVNSVRHPLTGRLMRLGGTPAGTAHARADSWPQVLAFLDETLRTR
jgi:dienelactone hydrolase